MDGYSKLQTFGGKGSKLVFYVNGTKVNKHSLVNLATTKLLNLQLIATQCLYFECKLEYGLVLTTY